MRNHEFEAKLTPKKLMAWDSFVNVVQGFLGNKKKEKTKILGKRLLTSYKESARRISLKMLSCIDFSLKILVQWVMNRERFHQDIKIMNTRYQEHWDPALIGDYWWFWWEKIKPNTREKMKQSTQAIVTMGSLFDFFFSINVRLPLWNIIMYISIILV